MLKELSQETTEKHWNTKAHGSKEDYSHKLHEDALDLQMELMLRGHSWKDYMDGPTNLEDVHSLLDKVLQDGGNYYDFVDQLDVPESKKEDYITSYEDQWIEDHYINKGTYPIDGTIEEKDVFAMSVIQKIIRKNIQIIKKKSKKLVLLSRRNVTKNTWLNKKSLLLKIEESKKAIIECSKLSPRFKLMALL